MAQISLSTDCNGKAHIVTIGDNELFFSYQTLIAFRGMTVDGFQKVRVENTWGATTGRHFNELGAKHFEVVSTEELAAIVTGAMVAPSREAIKAAEVTKAVAPVARMVDAGEFAAARTELEVLRKRFGDNEPELTRLGTFIELMEEAPAPWTGLTSPTANI